MKWWHWLSMTMIAVGAAFVAVGAYELRQCPHGVIAWRSIWGPLECHVEQPWPPQKIWCNCAKLIRV